MFIKKQEFNEVKIISSVLVYILISIVVMIPFIFVDESFFDSNSEIMELIVNTLFALFLFYKFGLNFQKLANLIKDYLEKINIKEILNVVFTQIIISVGATLLMLAVLCFVNIDLANSLNSSSDDLISNTVISFIITVLCAPIIKELFFRVVCFKRLSKIFDVYIGMVVSSICFGLLHVELAVVGAVIFGFANCILYLKYRNILIPMTVHFLNNLLVSIPMLFSGNDASSETELLTQSDASIYLVMGLIAFSIGVFLFVKFILKNRQYIEKDAFDMKTYKFKNSLF